MKRIFGLEVRRHIQSTRQRYFPTAKFVQHDSIGVALQRAAPAHLNGSRLRLEKINTGFVNGRRMEQWNEDEKGAGHQ